MSILLACSLVLSLGPVGLHGQVPNPLTDVRTRPPQIDDSWRDLLDRRIGRSAGGYAWVILRRGEILSAGGVGFARAGSSGVRRGRMLPTTRMQIASASKPVTAMAVVLAFEEHGLSLDAPMVSHIRDLPPKLGERVAEISVRQLLTHRSGYPFGYVYSPRVENMRRLLAQPVPNPPGDSTTYSNINFALARAVVEGVVGEPYPSYVARRLFAPAGVMDATLLPGPDDAFAHRFRTRIDGTPLALDFNDEGGPYGWYMTPLQLARWGDALVRGEVLPAPALATALREGVGWNVLNTPGGVVHRHDGQWVLEGSFGVRTSIVLAPDGVVAVLFVNTNTPFSPGQVLVEGITGLTPTFSLSPDRSTGGVLVHMNVPQGAKNIRFTTDGSEPTPRSRRYRGPLEVGEPVVIRAVGVRGGRVTTLTGSAEVRPPAGKGLPAPAGGAR